MKLINFFHFLKVHLKGKSLFSGIEDILKEFKSQFEGSNLNLQRPLEEYSDIEDMLKLESSEFEVSSFSLHVCFVYLDIS